MTQNRDKVLILGGSSEHDAQGWNVGKHDLKFYFHQQLSTNFFSLISVLKKKCIKVFLATI